MQKKYSVNNGRLLFSLLIFKLAFIAMLAVSGCCMPEEKVNKTIKNPVEPQVALVNAWQLIDQSDGKPITLTVTESGAFYGYGGVNNYNGSLHDSFKNGSFVINGTVAATMKYAHGIRRETLFFQQLNQVDSWVVNNECILELRKDDQVILRFMRQNKSGK